MVTGNFLVRHFLAIQQAIELKELGNAFWIPCFRNPADGVTELQGALVPRWRLLESGLYIPRTARPLRGEDFCERLIHLFLLLRPSLSCLLGPLASIVYMQAEFLICMLPLVGSGGVHLTPFSGEMDSRDPSRLLAELSQVLRERSDGAALRQGSVDAVQTTVCPGQRDLLADFPDAAKYSAFFQGTFEFALCFHGRCPQRAASLGILIRMLAWEWVAPQTKARAGDSNWLHADSLGSIADIFPDTVTVIGNCLSPLYVAGEVALAWFDSWMLINEQGVARRGRFFGDSATDGASVALRFTLSRAGAAQPLRLSSRGAAQPLRFRAPAQRNLRVRSLSLRAGCDLWEGGRHWVEPSDD